jgi:antitoxin (DNA-binding transcriptional repressor) of toxin-antitoxin stability system
VIGKARKPVARLVPYREDDTPRVPDERKGQVRISEDFDEMDAAFRGEHP